MDIAFTFRDFHVVYDLLFRIRITSQTWLASVAALLHVVYSS